MKIYRAGIEILDISVDEKSRLRRKLMAEDEVSIDVTVTSEIDIQLGDYLDYSGERYTLNHPPVVKRVGDLEFRYNMTFEGTKYRLLDKIYMLNNRAEFYLVGTVEQFIDLLIENINTIDQGWSKGDVLVSERKNLNFNCITCREVLTILAQEFFCEYTVTNKVISFFEKVENNTSLTFAVGMGKGLYELTRENIDNSDTVTRLWAYGGSRNLSSNYRDGERQLMFNERYLENLSAINRVVEKVVVFNDIYPRFEGAVSSVPFVVFGGAPFTILNCVDINFNPFDYKIQGANPKIVFTSGDLMGYQFEIDEYLWLCYVDPDTYNYATNPDDLPPGAVPLHRTMILKPIKNPDGSYLPTQTILPKQGDFFVITDILIPYSYVESAELRLKAEAQKYLDYYSRLRVSYKLKVDHRHIRKSGILLEVGDIVNVSDNELGIEEQVRVISFEKEVKTGHIVSAEVSNFRDEKYLKSLSDKLEDSFADPSINDSAMKAENYLAYNPQKDCLELLKPMRIGNWQLKQDGAGNLEFKNISTGNRGIVEPDGDVVSRG